MRIVLTHWSLCTNGRHQIFEKSDFIKLSNGRCLYPYGCSSYSDGGSVQSSSWFPDCPPSHWRWCRGRHGSCTNCNIISTQWPPNSKQKQKTNVPRTLCSPFWYRLLLTPTSRWWRGSCTNRLTGITMSRRDKKTKRIKDSRRQMRLESPIPVFCSGIVGGGDVAICVVSSPVIGVINIYILIVIREKWKHKIKKTYLSVL